jgi:hypothetical protein
MQNRVQRAYIKAKAIWESAEDQVSQLEAAFLASHDRTEKLWHL